MDYLCFTMLPPNFDLSVTGITTASTAVRSQAIGPHVHLINPGIQLPQSIYVRRTWSVTPGQTAACNPIYTPHPIDFLCIEHDTAPGPLQPLDAE